MRCTRLCPLKPGVTEVVSEEMLTVGRNLDRNGQTPFLHKNLLYIKTRLFYFQLFLSDFWSIRRFQWEALQDDGKPYTSRELSPLASSCTLYPTTWWAMNVCELTLAVSPPPQEKNRWFRRMLWRVRERSRSSSPSQLWVVGPLSPLAHVWDAPGFVP